MSPEHVTVGEFERWAKQLDTRLASIEGMHRTTVVEHGEEIAVLKDRSDRLEASDRRSKGVNSLISTVVSAIVSVGFKILFGR